MTTILPVFRGGFGLFRTPAVTFAAASIRPMTESTLLPKPAAEKEKAAARGRCGL
jgi:hypothetical protein